MTSVPSRRELLAWFVAFAMVVTVAIGWSTNRAEGADEGKTITTTQSEPVPETPTVTGTPQTVYLATGVNFPDALGAAGAAGVAMGPVLLVTQNSIPPETLAELNRLAPTRIVIVGGTAVISDTVKSQLEGLGFGPTVDRIAGTNRYDTAAKLSQDMNWTQGFMPQVAWAENTTDLLFGDNTDQVVLTIEHTSDRPGVYMLWGSADTYNGPDAIVSCKIAVDGLVIQSSRRDIELNGTDNSEENCYTQAPYFAEAGTRTFTFTINGDTGVNIGWRNLMLQWTAYTPGA